MSDNLDINDKAFAKAAPGTEGRAPGRIRRSGLCTLPSALLRDAASGTRATGDDIPY